MICYSKKLIKSFLKIGIPVNSFTKPFFSAIYLAHVFVHEAFIWAVRFFYYEPLFKSQCRKVGRGFWMEKLPYIVNSGNIVIGENVRFSGQPSFGFSPALGQAPLLVIGDNTFIGHLTSFNLGKSIEIGHNCLIAYNVRISDNDGHPLDYLDRRNYVALSHEDFKPVRIGNDVWVGASAVILKGVTIGDRAVIGSNALVTKDVAADTVVAGNPARVIKELS